MYSKVPRVKELLLLAGSRPLLRAGSSLELLRKGSIGGFSATPLRVCIGIFDFPKRPRNLNKQNLFIKRCLAEPGEAPLQHKEHNIEHRKEEERALGALADRLIERPAERETKERQQGEEPEGCSNADEAEIGHCLMSRSIGGASTNSTSTGMISKTSISSRLARNLACSIVMRKAIGRLDASLRNTHIRELRSRFSVLGSRLSVGVIYCLTPFFIMAWCLCAKL